MRLLRSGLLLLLVALVFTGCEETFLDPFDNDQRYYTVFGFLDPLEIRQTIRVIPVSRFPEDIEAPNENNSFIDARVYTRDLTDSTSTLWQHELAQQDDGSFVHLYHADFLVKAGHTYRLDIIRNDEKTTSATTIVPRAPSDKFVLASGPVVRADSTVYQVISLPGVPALWDLRAVYQVDGPGYRDRTFVDYETPAAPGPDGVWQYELNITADQDSIIARAQRYMQDQTFDTFPVTLTALGVQFRIIDSAWFPFFTEQDIVKLSQPGYASNVVNGYGVFGSLGLHSEEWEVSPQVAEALGYPITVDLDAAF